MRIMIMNAMSKIAIISASVLTMGALSACQTTTAPQENKQYKKHHHQHISAEMREKHRADKTERKAYFEQAQKACDGKAVGQAVQIKVADKVIDGSCNIYFKADRKDMKHARSEQRPMRDLEQNRGLRHSSGELLTDAKRAELTKQFDQRLANRQAKQQAFLKACEGQTHAKAVQIKLNEKLINGQCQVRFQPKMLKTTPASKTA